MFSLKLPEMCLFDTLSCPCWVSGLQTCLSLLLTCAGEIKSSVTLDRETNPNYRLTAEATDGGGRWCRAEVQLVVTDVNDNPPLFTLSQYYVSVYEDTPVKALLTRIHAVDPDEGDDRPTVTAQSAVIADNVVITNLTAWPNIIFTGTYLLFY